MRVSLRLPLAAATAALLLCGAARADGPADDPTGSGASVGVGMICNTSEQAEQFLALRSNGAKPEQAMASVNEKAHDPRACGLAAIAFTRDTTLDSKPVDNKLVQIVRINVIAGFNGSGWQRIAGMTQYAVIEGEGEAI